MVCYSTPLNHKVSYCDFWLQCDSKLMNVIFDLVLWSCTFLLRVKKLQNCGGSKLFKDLYTKEPICSLFMLYRFNILNFANIGAV